MKLIRFGSPGNEKPGLEVDGIRYDVSHLVEDYTEEFFSKNGISKLKQEFDENTSDRIDPEIRLGVPVSKPGVLNIDMEQNKSIANEKS
jgi:hypothetical protein